MKKKKKGEGESRKASVCVCVSVSSFGWHSNVPKSTRQLDKLICFLKYILFFISFHFIGDQCFVSYEQFARDQNDTKRATKNRTARCRGSTSIVYFVFSRLIWFVSFLSSSNGHWPLTVLHFEIVRSVSIVRLFRLLTDWRVAIKRNQTKPERANDFDSDSAFECGSRFCFIVKILPNITRIVFGWSD